MQKRPLRMILEHRIELQTRSDLVILKDCKSVLYFSDTYSLTSLWLEDTIFFTASPR